MQKRIQNSAKYLLMELFEKRHLEMFDEVMNKPLPYNVKKLQKEHSRGVLTKSCSKNIQHVYRKTSIPKKDFNKVA